jgi:hypothetical protein
MTLILFWYLVDDDVMMAGCSHWPTSPNSPKSGRDDDGELRTTEDDEHGASIMAVMVGGFFLLYLKILVQL